MQNKVIQITNKNSKRSQMCSQKEIIRIKNNKPIYNQRSQDFQIQHNKDIKPDNGKPIYTFNIK